MNNLVLQIAQKYQQAFYLYDAKIVSKQIDTLKNNFTQVDFLYSIKTNPFTPVIKHVASQQLGADAASAAEVQLALNAGIMAGNIYYSAPGKIEQDITQSLEHCTIIADSYTELETIDAIAKTKNLTVQVGLRINPVLGMFDNKQGSSKFGIDEETLIEHQSLFKRLTNTVITGIHTHLRSQILDASTLQQYYKNVFLLAEFCQKQLHFDIRFINFGGGLGIPYSTRNDTALNIHQLGKQFQQLAQQYNTMNARLLIETGRFIIGEAGTYITPIVDIKKSRGVKYLIVRNGLNGFLRPSIAALLKQFHADLNHFSAEPLFTGIDAFDISILGKTGNEEKVTIAGNLCTSTDLIGENLLLPQAQIGDFITVSKAGSYSYTLSPLLFSSHDKPLQLFLTTTGQVVES